jgi:FKBP-type peptidyl-prolyl cis-trans isomerase
MKGNDVMQLKINGFLSIILVWAISAATVVLAQSDTPDENTNNLPGMVYWNNIDKPAITTESGLQYKVQIEGRGRKPKPSATVSVHYRGILLDGREFDNSYLGDEPVRLNLKRVIDGWGEGLQLMSPGSMYVFLIPPELAYGEKGSGEIPPDSTLIFEIELFKSK